MHRIVTAALAIMQVATSAGAQAPGAIIVFGVVRNAEGVAIPGAEVWMEGTDLRVASNDSGEFRLSGAASGHGKLMVRRIGFRPDSKRLTLAPGDTKQVKFVLEGMADELDAVVVMARDGSNGRMGEFWARRMTGLGVFMTRAEIDRRHPPQTSDLFRTVMGVRVVPSNSTGGTRLVTGRAGSVGTGNARSAASSACPMQYYVDGMFMAPGTFTVDDVPPADLEAIEIFRGPSEIPARFRQRETACGLVVIWTREPPPRTKREKDGS